MNIRVKIGDQIFVVEVGDVSARPILANVDCDTFEVWPEDEGLLVKPAVNEKKIIPAAPGPRPSAPSANGSKNKMVLAPIPGVIISITVKPGDAVAPGQELLVLEAMKMKNSIRATRTATVAAIQVGVGDHVRHGQPLVEFSD